MAGYVRQSAANIQTGLTVQAADINAEYNQLQSAFSATNGHKHDGSSAEGPPITVLGPTQDFIATTSFFRPKTDDALDLGTPTFEFKDGYFDGVVYTDGLNFNGVGITATGAEINRLSGVTSAIQSQLNGKVNTTLVLTAGDGLTGLGNLSANRTVSVDSTVVRTTRTLTAGDGLTGLGNLSANRTVTLGTPSTLTGSTTNAVTSTSHTHALSGQLSRLDAVSGSGMVVRDSTNQFLTRSLAGGSGIGITNATGVDGNPTASVDSTVVRTSGNQTLDGNKTFNDVLIALNHARFGQSASNVPGSGNTTTGAAFNIDGILSVSRATSSAARFNTNASGSVVDFNRQGDTKGNISVTASDAVFVNLSDPFLKENVSPAPDAGSVIDAIQVVEYDWIESGEHIRWGLLATDVAYHAPEAAYIPSDPEKPWGYSADHLVPILWQEVRSLRQRVGELEGGV